MLRVLSDLFESLRTAREGAVAAEDDRHALELATAVLLIEVSRADGRLDDAERVVVLQALHSKFSLSGDELAQLFELAHSCSEEAHDLYGFTSRLNQSLDEPQRIRVFRMLWEVAYADGQLSAHETHLLRRLADLLHIRHGDAVQARLRAEAGSPTD